MLIDELSKAWREREAMTPIEPELTFTDEGLVLGAGTIVATAAPEAGATLVRIDGAEDRIVVLLSAAYGRRIGPEALGHLRRAASRWNDREPAMAAMHLAQARLGRLRPAREASRKLFLADSLLAAGAEPATVLKALDLGPAVLARAYNAEEPRVPDGNGVVSGEWTSGYTSGGNSASAASTSAQAAGST